MVAQMLVFSNRDCCAGARSYKFMIGVALARLLGASLALRALLEPPQEHPQEPPRSPSAARPNKPRNGRGACRREELYQ